jgi:hypothetical protein
VSEQPTCGKGLAEHSVFPARFGDLLAAMAENLEVHLRTLDASDRTTEAEREAYTRLARESRRLAGELDQLAVAMAGYRDLPMGRHDPAALASAPVIEAFVRFVKLQRELLALLEKSVAAGQEMLSNAGA